MFHDTNKQLFSSVKRLVVIYALVFIQVILILSIPTSSMFHLVWLRLQERQVSRHFHSMIHLYSVIRAVHGKPYPAPRCIGRCGACIHNVLRFVLQNRCNKQNQAGNPYVEIYYILRSNPDFCPVLLLYKG